MSNELERKELLEYLEVWKDAFKREVEKSKFISMMDKQIKQTELERIEQAYKQVCQLIEERSEQDEIHCNFIDIIIDLYEQLEKK